MFPSFFLLLIDIACCLLCETISKAWVMSDEWVLTTQKTEHRLQNTGDSSWDLQAAKESKIKLEWVVLKKKCFFEDQEFSVVLFFVKKCPRNPRRRRRRRRSWQRKRVYSCSHLPGRMTIVFCVFNFCMKNNMIWCSWSWTR